NRGSWKDPQESSKRHLPSRRRIVRRAKPRFQPMQRPGVPRTRLRQWLTFRVPRLEDRRCVKGVALVFIRERAQDAKLTRVRTRQRPNHGRAQHAAVRERGLEKLTQRHLKLGFAAGSHTAGYRNVNGHNLVAQTFLSAGSGDFPVARWNSGL